MTNPGNSKASGIRGSRSAPPTNAFPKGISGNPKGRPIDTPEEREAKAMLLAATPKAVKALVEVLETGDIDQRIKAAVAILGKAWPTGIDLTISAPNGLDMRVMRVDMTKATPDQLAALKSLSSGEAS